MILLDTNIVSENFRPRPNPGVLAWINSQSPAELFICAPVLAELHYGAELLSAGRNQTYLRAAIEQIETALFAGRILPLDAGAAAHYGRLVAQRKNSGRPIHQMDALIAAIALANRTSLATRNIRHFENLGLELINPFDPDFIQ